MPRTGRRKPKANKAGDETQRPGGTGGNGGNGERGQTGSFPNSENLQSRLLEQISESLPSVPEFPRISRRDKLAAEYERVHVALAKLIDKDDICPKKKNHNKDRQS